MENTEHFNETEYMKGFNQGYALSQTFPEFANVINSISGKSDLLDGMKDGREQFLEEEMNKFLDRSDNRTEQNLPDFLKRNSFENKNNDDRDIEKDIEPER